MLDLFRRAGAAPVDTSALGVSALAMVVPAGSAIAAGCTAVLIDQGGHTRRLAEAAGRLAPAPNEVAWLFRPGPYQFDLRPFTAAAELGLRLRILIDSADPRASQQRFDLYLASEAGGADTTVLGVLSSSAFFAAIEDAVQRELAQGHLDLPPCTSLAEWNAFRSGLDRLLYVRFGVTVDECLPVDLGDTVDFAAILKSRVPVPLEQAAPDPAPPASTAAVKVVPAPAPLDDARALRRLFLELPYMMVALRLAVLPRGQDQFQRHQDLLRRLDLASLSVTTMPALGVSAPGVALDAVNQVRRIAYSRQACRSLDEAWALLARLQREDESDAASSSCEAAIAALFDDAARIVANLETDLAGRRASVEAAA